MALRDSVRVSRRHVVVVLLAATAGALASTAVSLRQPDEYRTTLALLITAPDGGGAGPPGALLDQTALLAQLATTPPAARAAAEAAGTTPTFSVAAGADGLSPYVNLEVRGTDARAVAAVADAYAQVLPGLAVDLAGVPASQVVQTTALGDAPVPAEPVSRPLSRDVATGLLVGAAAGSAALLGAAGLDRRAAPLEDVVDGAGGRVPPGTVPWQAPDVPLAVQTDPAGARSEAYRSLRTALALGHPDAVVVLVVPAGPQVGASTLTANLALAAAADGERVMVVDANLRRPSLHHLFAVSGSVGLGDVLVHGLPLEHAVIDVAERTCLLPAGHRPPQEALTRSTLPDLLRRLTADRDRVLVDGPPPANAADLAVLSAHCDAVLVVARAGVTVPADVATTRRLLSRAGTRSVEVVVQGADPSDGRSRAGRGRRRSGGGSGADL